MMLNRIVGIVLVIVCVLLLVAPAPAADNFCRDYRGPNWDAWKQRCTRTAMSYAASVWSVPTQPVTSGSLLTRGSAMTAAPFDSLRSCQAYLASWLKMSRDKDPGTTMTGECRESGVATFER